MRRATRVGTTFSPVMVGLGLAAQTALGPARKRLPILTAALLVVFGLLIPVLLWRSLSLVGSDDEEAEE